MYGVLNIIQNNRYHYHDNISKKQIWLSVLAVVFATSDNAFARINHKHISQSIGQNCSQNQKSNIQTAGALSPITLSGNNIILCVNANFGGNAANQQN